MKKLKQYTSPAVRFETLRLQESIADTCWGWANRNGVDNMYYDTEGKGYVHFSVSGGNCSKGSGLDVTINEYVGISDQTAQADAKKEFDAWWNSPEVQAGSSSYKGDGYSETPPSPDWSN